MQTSIWQIKWTGHGNRLEAIGGGEKIDSGSRADGGKGEEGQIPGGGNILIFFFTTPPSLNYSIVFQETWKCYK